MDAVLLSNKLVSLCAPEQVSRKRYTRIDKR